MNSQTIKIIFIIQLFMIFFSCKKEELNKTEELFAGTYTGIFIRTSPNIKTIPSNVKLIFRADSFFGESSTVKYPAICAGTFKNTGQEIDFQNSCIWTTEFDWTLILDGKYQVTKNDTLLIIKKTIGNTHDKYELKKK